jgi:release factor glutamine methyltransferase
MPSLRTLLADAQTRLEPVWGHPLALRLARELAATLLKRDTVWLLAHDQESVTKRFARTHISRVRRLAQREPLALILGAAPFYGRSFRVTRSTLIPRIETEELVQHVLRTWNPRDTSVLALDIGTGSGCIGITLALERDPAQVILSDRYARPLAIAKESARTLLGATKARDLTFVQTPLFSPALQRLVRKRAPKTLLLVANLPYIPAKDTRELKNTSTKYEPLSALVGGTQGDELIKTTILELVAFASNAPSTRIEAWFEIDPRTQTSLAGLCETLSGWNATFLNDQFDRVRFLHLRRV